MLIEITALALGIIIGTLTGLFPGIHINLVIVFLSTLLSYNLGIPILSLIIFIVSLSVTHTFLDFIPGIFLGCPDEDTALSVLPGHQMLKEGKGMDMSGGMDQKQMMKLARKFGKKKMRF